MLRQGKDFSDDQILGLFLFLPKILLGLFVLFIVSVLCALGSVCPHPGPEKPPQVSTLSLTTTGHVFQAKRDRGAGPVGPRWCPLIRVGQEALLSSLECLLPCEPLHPQEVAP